MVSELSITGLIQRAIIADEDAWKEFMRRFQPVIAASAARVLRQQGVAEPSAVEEVVQEVYLKLCDGNCRILREFQAEREDSLHAFLKVVSANMARDRSDALTAAKRSGRATVSLSNQVVKDKGEFENRLERELFIEKVEGALTECTDNARFTHDRTIFWLYHRQGLTAREIAAIPAFSLTDKGVQSLLSRLLHCIRIRLIGRSGRANAASGLPNPF